MGSGASAAVLGPADKHPEGHRILGGITRAATQHHELCVGDHNGMFTDTKGLLAGGMELVVAAWEEAHETGWDWRNMDRYVMHQVSDVHTNSITKAAGLDPERIPVTYPELATSGPPPCRSRSAVRSRRSSAATGSCAWAWDRGSTPP